MDKTLILWMLVLLALTLPGIQGNFWKRLVEFAVLMCYLCVIAHTLVEY